MEQANSFHNSLNPSGNRQYLCIDLKSFYASVECVERGLDPLTTNLVVADPDRTEKTICLAITPSMKALGIKNRCRVFEIPPSVDYIMAVPRMQLYIDYSANIYAIYLKYISKDDIHVYSIDEAFMDVTDYLVMYHLSAKELAKKIMADIYQTTGITATAGIGSNLYLAKIALDITAKHAKDHIGILDEVSFVETLSTHKPLTDFWRIGPGISKKLANYGIYTMKDIREYDEAYLYKLFGIDAELLIDHAYGRESTTIADIKNFKPKNTSLSSGQVLPCDYSYEDGLLLVKEMADLLCLDLVDKNLLTDSIYLHISYSASFANEPARGTRALPFKTSSGKVIMAEMEELYKKIVNPHAFIRRIQMSFSNLSDDAYVQYDFFCSPEDLEKENKMQKAIVDLQKKFGKNAVLKGMNLDKAGKTIERNMQIGGHRSGN